MAHTLVNATGAIYGVPLDETGVNMEEFKVSVEPEYREPLMSIDNTVRGFAIASQKLTLDMSGETLGVAGPLAATTTTAYTPANSTNYWNAPQTSLLLTKGDVTKNRAAWQKFTANFEAYAGVSL